ncbi:MAG: ZIP family metal transporter [Acidimicrobiia bacterium]|nr:ZIP family metal transporter [Acidimicrobiia bacterium]
MDLATQRPTGGAARTAALFAIPLIGLMALVALLFVGDPLRSFRTGPPIEEATVERTVLRPGEIELHLRNAGPDPVRVAQVLVNDAFWAFDMTDRHLGRLEAATLAIPYPWDEGTTVTVSVITASGATIEHTIDTAAETPTRDADTLRRYILLGLFIGPLPVTIGLLAKPALTRLGPGLLTVLLAVTVGLLLFLLVDTLVEGVEQALLAGPLDGFGLLVLGGGAAVALLASVPPGKGGEGVALLVATGIGLHNLGEGLAVGSAIATGSIGLGATLVAGFVLHNTTEGLAIATPLVRGHKATNLARLGLLVTVAGGPAVLGTVLGGYATTSAVAAFTFGAAAGALAQVTWVVGRELTAERRPSGIGPALGFLAGLAVMYATGLFAG